MGFITTNFLGGAARKAAKAQKNAARTGQGFIRDATSGARDELNTGFDNSDSFLNDFFGQAQDTQITGLQDIISALTGGSENAISTIEGSTEQGLQALLQGLSGSEELLNPFIEGGSGAFDLQQALSGALGDGAQSKAFEDFQSSPGQQFLRDQGELSISRNAGASGGLGGGALLTDLQEFGTGLAAQDFNNQFNRLGQLAGRGQQASSELSNTRLGTGSNIASLFSNSGSNIANIQSRLGELIGNATGNTANANSGLLSTLGQLLSGNSLSRGSNLAQLLLGQGTNLSNLEQGFGAADAQGILGASNALRGTLSGVGKFAAAGGFKDAIGGITEAFAPAPATE